MPKYSVLLVGCLLLMLSSAFAVEPIVVIVDGASLDDPVGAGFSHWEGAEPLQISLSATDPDEISKAEPYLPEEVAWSQIQGSASDGDPWVFETAAVLPDEGFAVIFKGLLAGDGQGGGTGGSEWAAGVSRIDIDCDSDNDSTDTPRSPSCSDYEDDIEFVDGSSATTAGGMVMASGDGWAELRITAHLKCDGVVCVAISGDRFAFEVSEYSDGSVLLGLVEDPVYQPDSGDVVYEDRYAQAGPYSKTLYVRPVAGGDEDEAIVAGAFFAPGKEGQPASTAQKAEDKVAVTNSSWKLAVPSSRVVLVEAGGNYDPPVATEPPYSPAKMKRMVVKGPGGATFVLKRNESPKLRVYKVVGETKTELEWNSARVSETLTLSSEGVTELWVKGLAVADENINSAHLSASSSPNDQVIELKAGTQQAPGGVLDTCTWTALWVKLELVASSAATVSADNRALPWYKKAMETTSLGVLGDGADGTRLGIRVAVEIKGTVFPNGMEEREYRMRRYLLGCRYYINGEGQQHEVYGAKGTKDDTSLCSMRDELSKSGSSNNCVYDLDGPGYEGTKNAPDNNALENCAIGGTVAMRHNFVQWAELGGELCTKKMAWYSRRAAKKKADGSWESITAMPGDNSAGEGKTGLGYAGSLPFRVDLFASPAECTDGSDQLKNVSLVAKMVGGKPDYTVRWFFQNVAGYKEDSGNKVTFNATTPVPLKTDDKNKGEHHIMVFARASDGNEDYYFDKVYETLYTNRTPQVRLVCKYDGVALVTEAYASDPDPKDTVAPTWTAVAMDSNGQPVADLSDSLQGTSLSGKKSRIIWREGWKSVVVALDVKDSHGLVSTDMATVDK